MSEAIGRPDLALLAMLRDHEARLASLERTPSALGSIGLIYLRPGIKAGTPSDADYPAAAMPPIGSAVTDVAGSKLWVRTAAATWKGVVIA